MSNGYWSFQLDIDNDTDNNLNIQAQALPSGTGWIPGYAVEGGTWLSPPGQSGLTAGVYSNDPEWPPSMTFVVPSPDGTGTAFIGASVDTNGQVSCYLLANDYYHAVVVQYPGTVDDPLPNHPYCSMTLFPGGTNVPNGLNPPSSGLEAGQALGGQQPSQEAALGLEADPGLDKGFRSIEINFNSRVDAERIMVLEAVLDNPDCQWIGGEVAGTGAPILPGMPWTWGVSVYLPPATAGASMSFSQMGQPRGGLVFSNGPDGTSTCTFTPAGGLTATVTQEDTGDPNHSAFSVLLEGTPG